MIVTIGGQRVPVQVYSSGLSRATEQAQFDALLAALQAGSLVAPALGVIWAHNYASSDGDGPMLRRAKAAALAAGKPIDMLPGDYVINGTADGANGLIIVGAGQSVTFMCSTGVATFSAPENTNREIITATGAGANLTLRNVHMDGRNITSGFSMRVENAGDFKAENTGVRYRGLRFIGTNGRIEIDGFSANRTQGHALSGGAISGEAFGSTQGGWIKGFNALDCKKSGINLTATKNLSTLLIEQPVVRWKRWETEGVAYPSRYAALRLGNGTSNVTVTNLYGEGVYRLVRLTDTDNCWVYGADGLNILGPFALFNSKDQVARNSGIIGLTGVGPCRYLGRADQSPATGTIVTSTASATVTGTGTIFREELIVGQALYKTDRSLIGTILTVNSDTSVTLTSNAAVTINPGAAFQFGAVDEDGEGVQGESSVAFAISKGVAWAASGVSISADEYILQLGTNLSIAGSATLQNRDSVLSGQDFNCFDDMAVGDLVFDDAENLIGRVQSISAKTYWTDAKETTSQLTVTGADHASQTITLDAGALLTSKTATGTIAVTIDTTAVVGTGTAFLTQLAVGSNLYDATGAYIGRVAAIADDLNLTLAGTGAKVGVAGAAFLRSATYYQRRPDAYFFTPGNGTITGTTGSPTITGLNSAFTTQLQAGDILFNDSRQVIGVLASTPGSDTSLTLTANALRAITGGLFQFGRPKKVTRGLEIAATATSTVVDLEDIYVRGAILQHYVEQPECLRERADWTITKASLARLDATKRRGEIWNVSDIVPAGPVRSNGTEWEKLIPGGVQTVTTVGDFTATYLEFGEFIRLTGTQVANQNITVSFTGRPNKSEMVFHHLASDTFSRLIKDPGGTTILTLRPGQIGRVIYDATGTPTLRRGGIVPGASAAPMVRNVTDTPATTLAGDTYAPISADVTLTVGPSGANFTEPGAAMNWLQRFRILPGVTVTVTIADGTYAATTIKGHVDGDRINWTTGGLNGAALVIGDFTLTGSSAPQRAADKTANESVVRAKYKVILEFASGDAGFASGGRHLGSWGALLAINTGTTTFGVTTGSGGVAGDGDGGRGNFTNCCFYGFTNACGLTDYGGIINDPSCLYLFGGGSCRRTDFAGGFYGAGVILIGGGDYCHRGNHGGFAYSSGAVIRNAGISNVEMTNSPSMGWFHDSDIQGAAIYGVSCTWGGTCKVFNATVRNNGTAQVRASAGSSIDARSATMASTGTPTYGAFCTNSNIDVSSATISGHTRDIDVIGSGGVLAGSTTATTIYAGGVVVTADSANMVRDNRSNTVARPASATLTPVAGVLDLGSNPAKIVSVASSSTGAPDTITSITYASLPVGDSVTFRAINAGTGETINFTDSTGLPLGANRALTNVRDQLTLVRNSTATTGSLVEQSFSDNA